MALQDKRLTFAIGFFFVMTLYCRLRHSDTPKVSLFNQQSDIVNFCSVPRTTKEILDSIGVCIHSKNREVTSPPLSQQAFFK